MLGPIDLLTTSADTRYARWCMNCWFDREGQLERRPGMTKVGAQGGNGLVALSQGQIFIYYHDQSAGTVNVGTL